MMEENQTQIGGLQFQYDAENRMITSSFNQTTAQYTYDGLGHRVTKTVGGQTTTYVYDPFGNLAQEYGPASPVTAPEYLVADALGSTRLVIDSSGAALRCYDYLPFGEELAAGTGGRTAPCFGNATYPASGPDVVNRKAARVTGRTALQRNAIVIDRFFESREAALAWERLHPHFMTVRVVQPESREKLEISKPEMPTIETHTAALPKTSKLESPVNADGTEFAGPIDPLMRLARRSAL